MTRVDFYHLKKDSLEQVLPKLLEKGYDAKALIKVKVGTAERVEFINSMLWTYEDFSFLPHGTAKDGNISAQPIFLSSEDDNPNNASMLFLVDGALVAFEELEKFERVFNIFDGNAEESLTQAREFWKSLKDKIEELNYWQQDDKGNWVKK